MEIILLFILGLCVGSFLNVVADRTDTKKSIVHGRSECDYCEHTLGAFELFPILSFALQGGKTRCCHKKLSYYYPISELITGFLFAVTSYLFRDENIIALAAHFLAVLSLLGIFFVDLKKGLIPLIFTGILLLAGIILLILSPSLLLANVLSALGACLFFLAIFVLSKGRGMGLGDVIFSLAMGLLLGFPDIIFGLYTAFLTGAIVSLILILLGKKKLRGDTVPFGPFLVFGTLLLLFFGKIITPTIISLLF